MLSVNVNENDTCNAYSTGDDIHFFISNTMCENTGRIRDVVYHEFGHSVHFNSIIPGVGAFDSSLSEGLADTLAVSITGDPGVGRGFFYNTTPIRDLDPATPKRWPQDADGEPHDEGEIIGESLWDLRKALIAKLGDGPGFDRTLLIYYGVVQRAADIPSTYVEALVADDDDGDLTNGTPDLCEINAAFGPHGLTDPATTLGLQAPTRDNFTISLVTKPSPALAACDGAVATVTSTQVAWRMRGAPDSAAEQTIDLVDANDTFTGTIPTQADGAVVEYKVTVTLSTGATLVYPNNPADPYYQFYVGTPVTQADPVRGLRDRRDGLDPCGQPDESRRVAGRPADGPRR